MKSVLLKLSRRLLLYRYSDITPIVAIPTTVRQNLLTFIRKVLRYLSNIAHFNTKKKIYIPQKANRVN